MLIPIGLLVAAVIGELCVTYRPLRRLRTGLAVAVSGLFVAASAALLVEFPGLSSALVAVVSLYSIYNLARLVSGKAHEQYLVHSVNHTAVWLGAAHIGLAYCVLVLDRWPVPFEAYAVALAGLQLAVAAVILWSTRRQLRAAQPMRHIPEISDSHLPTVTVAVPVRNEGGQLEACLTSILSSNYPKLEVLAFDDHSSDKTPEIIHSFAHSGVRFIRTAEPSDGWLAKNRAYDSLAVAANGEYILFCGADIRLAPRSLRTLAGIMVHKRKAMLAILPQNRAVTRMPLLQAMRYYWEMAPPRRLFRRPPVLSSCWMVEWRMLEKAGGFAAVRRSMSPEAHLARYASGYGDGYSFVRSGKRLDITSEKSTRDQRATALLRRYPQVHRRPEMVLMFGFGQALLLLGPPVLSIAGLVRGVWWPVLPLAMLALVVHSAAFGATQRTVFPRVPAWRAYLALLPCITADIWYLNRSMHAYEFGDVAWKDRSVSGPVMRATGAGHSQRPG